jgi:hypothetical protein
MTIRPARPEDGPAIGKLFLGTADATGIDWARPEIADWWIVAEHDGEVVGAVQVSCSQPAGYIGQLVVKPEWRGRRADGHGSLAPRGSALARTLYYAAEAVLVKAGVQCITTALRPSRGWRRIVERWGGVAMLEGLTLMRKDVR